MFQEVWQRAHRPGGSRGRKALLYTVNKGRVLHDWHLRTLAPCKSDQGRLALVCIGSEFSVQRCEIVQKLDATLTAC